VHEGLDCGGEEFGWLLGVEVGDANVADFAFANELFYFFPSLRSRSVSL